LNKNDDSAVSILSADLINIQYGIIIVSYVPFKLQQRTNSTLSFYNIVIQTF